MIYFSDYYKDHTMYMSSDLQKGIVPFPVPFKMILHTFDNITPLNVLGTPPSLNAKLADTNTMPDKNTHNQEVISKKKKGPIIKYQWPVDEQFSYFVDKSLIVDNYGLTNYNPKVVAFDIEIATKMGEEPDPLKHKVLMIGYQFMDEEIIIADQPVEIDTIFQFFEFLRDKDPDIIAGYYSRLFDVPYLLKRITKLGYKFPSYLHRAEPTAKYNQNVMVISSFNRNDRKLEDYTKAQLSLGYGRSHYDIFSASVKQDTYLVGKVKNMRLKTIAEFYGSDSVFNISDQEKTDMDTLYEQDRERMHVYLQSDIRQTTFLFKLYYPSKANMCSIINVPFDYIVSSSGRATFAKVFMTRLFIQNGYYPIIRNSKKPKNIPVYNLIKSQGEKASYRGAYTGIENTGRFDNISKVDFSSMYPSIIVTFNISPETVVYIGHEDIDTVYQEYKENIKYSIDKAVISNNYYPIILDERTDTYIRVKIPDEQLGYYFHIQIDITSPSILSVGIQDVLNNRAAIRKDMKRLDKHSNEYVIKDAEQLSYKIIANSMYGILGNEWFEVGDIAGAMLVTAFGREIAHYIVAKAKELGVTVVEIDTDGVYVNGHVDVDQLNSYLDEVLHEKYAPFLITQRMTLDLEKSNIKGLFLGMKNYVLKDGDNIIIAGSSLKGSTKPPIFEKIIEQVITAVMNDMPTHELNGLINTLIDADYPSEDYKVTMAITKQISDYKANGGIQEALLFIINNKDLFTPKKAYAHITSILKQWFYGNAEYGDDVKTTWEKRGKAILKDKNSLDKLHDLTKTARNIVDEYDKELAQSSSNTSFPVKILQEALKDGIQITVGDVIEYYYRSHTHDIMIFSDKNLKMFPPSKDAYMLAIRNVLNNIISVLNAQSSSTIW